MESLTLEQVIQAWLDHHDNTIKRHGPNTLERSQELTDGVLHLLAEGNPVSPKRLAAYLSWPTEVVEAAFTKYQAQGGEFDENGYLVGAALTLNPTPHTFILDDKKFYTWCALDALFIPGLIGQTAKVESSCPETGDIISLTVTPQGVTQYYPAEAVLTVAIPGVSCAIGEDRDTGPSSRTCTQMHLFANCAAAQKWVQSYPGVVILTIEQAWQLAYRNWIARRKHR